MHTPIVGTLSTAVTVRGVLIVPGGAAQSSVTSGPSISRTRSAMPSVIPSGAERNFCRVRGSGLGARGSGRGARVRVRVRVRVRGSGSGSGEDECEGEGEREGSG
jgi:hypothetical protein